MQNRVLRNLLKLLRKIQFVSISKNWNLHYELAKSFWSNTSPFVQKIRKILVCHRIKRSKRWLNRKFGASSPTPTFPAYFLGASTYCFGQASQFKQKHCYVRIFSALADTKVLAVRVIINNGEGLLGRQTVPSWLLKSLADIPINFSTKLCVWLQYFKTSSVRFCKRFFHFSSLPM